MATRTASQDGDWNLTATWGGASVPATSQPYDDVIIAPARQIFIDDGDVGYAATMNGVGGAGGRVTLHVGSALNCVSITDVRLIVDGLNVTINSVNEPGVIQGDQALLDISANCSVMGYADITSTNSISGLVNNAGTITEWHGDIVNSGYYGLTNGGTIVAWYGDITNSGYYGVQQGGALGAWYGDVTNSGYGMGVYVQGDGVVDAWYGNVTNSGSGYYNRGVSNGFWFPGIIKAWYGNVTNSGYYGVFNTLDSTIEKWYGNVTSSGYGNGIGVYNMGTIESWYGSVSGSYHVGVQNGGYITEWYGDVYSYNNGIGVLNGADITAWYGNVICNGGDRCVWNTRSAGARIKARYGDVTHISGSNAVDLSQGLCTAWYGDVYGTSAVNIASGKITNWYATFDCSASFSDPHAYFSSNDAARTAIKDARQKMLYGGTFSGYTIQGYYAGLPIAPAQLADPADVLYGDKLWLDDPAASPAKGTLTVAGFDSTIASAPKVLTGTPRYTSGPNGSLPYSRKHGAAR